MGKQKEMLDKIAKAVESLADTDVWDEYLAFASRFHRYSFGNQILIWSQKPDATYVAGYKRWKELGRQVQKGERGIAILVPMPYKKKTAEGDEEIKMWFGTGYVFDISQTEGDPVPEIAPVIAGDNWKALLDKLTAVADDLGMEVQWTEEMSSDGDVDYTRIRVNASKPPNHQVSVLAHELAHVQLGHKGRRSIGRERREFEAESVAYMVMASFGCDVEAHASGYLLAWAQGQADKFKEALQESGDLICKAAKALLEQAQKEAA